jgi:hypothetical protein
MAFWWFTGYEPGSPHPLRGEVTTAIWWSHDTALEDS